MFVNIDIYTHTHTYTCVTSVKRLWGQSQWQHALECDRRRTKGGQSEGDGRVSETWENKTSFC